MLKTHSHTLFHSHTLSFSHSFTLDMLNNFCFNVYAQKSHSHTLSLFHSLIHSLSTCYKPTFVFMSMLKSHSLTFTISRSRTLTLSHSLIHSLSMLNNFCFYVYAQNLLSHFLTLTLSHSHSFSLSHSFNLSFNHSRHAEQVLFSSLCSKFAVYRRKLQCVFLAGNQLYEQKLFSMLRESESENESV